VGVPIASYVAYGVSFSVEYLLICQSIARCRKLSESIHGAEQRLRTPHDRQYEAGTEIGGYGGILLGIHAAARRPETESLDEVSMFEVSLVLD
jgi:hypothetical protein